jgi:hypothetical protein
LFFSLEHEFLVGNSIQSGWVEADEALVVTKVCELPPISTGQSA